jgi:hypothetical protein
LIEPLRRMLRAQRQTGIAGEIDQGAGGHGGRRGFGAGADLLQLEVGRARQLRAQRAAAAAVTRESTDTGSFYDIERCQQVRSEVVGVPSQGRRVVDVRPPRGLRHEAPALAEPRHGGFDLVHPTVVREEVNLSGFDLLLDPSKEQVTAVMDLDGLSELGLG